MSTYQVTLNVGKPSRPINRVFTIVADSADDARVAVIRSYEGSGINQVTTVKL